MARRRRWKGAQLDGLLSTPIAANFGSGPEEAAEGCAAGQGIRFARLPPSTLGLDRRRRRRGMQLDRELLCMPRAANFGPGQEAAAEERSAGLGVCFVGLALPTSGLARRRRQRGLQLDRELLCMPPSVHFGPGPEGAAEGGAAGRGVALYASRRRLWAWPGGGGGRAHSWSGSLLSTPLAADSGPGPEAAEEGPLPW